MAKIFVLEHAKDETVYSRNLIQNYQTRQEPARSRSLIETTKGPSIGDAPRFFESNQELSKKSLIPGPGTYDPSKNFNSSNRRQMPKKSQSMADL